MQKEQRIHAAPKASRTSQRHPNLIKFNHAFKFHPSLKGMNSLYILSPYSECSKKHQLDRSDWGCAGM